MRIRKWQRPNSDEVRYYIDLSFGAAPFLPRDANRLLHGRWIGTDDDGQAHVYTKTQVGTGRCRSEDGEWLDKAIGIDGQTFAEWETTYAACLTKSGNFSLSKYMKI